jgi:hypothetical protein
MGCVQSVNMVCKHVEASDIYYVDLAPLLGTGETITSVTSVTASDAAITDSAPGVLSVDTTVTKTTRDEDGNTRTVAYVIEAVKGVYFTLSGGTTGAGCGTVTVVFLKSTGKTDAIDCLLEVAGVDV